MKHLERALDGQNQWWKYLVVFLIGFLGIISVSALSLKIFTFIREMQGIGVNKPNIFDGIDLNIALLLNLFPYIIGLIIVTPLIKSFHNRSLAEIINGTKKIRWNRFFFSMGIWTILLIASLVIEYLVSPQDFILQFQPLRFIILLILSITLIPLQTTFEEVFFRGYLMQGISVWTKNRLLAIVIPGILFGLLHYNNPEVKEYGFWLAMPQYIVYGLLFGIIVVLDDGIETTMGAHAANNILLCVFVTSKSSALQTYALFEQINQKPSIMDTLIMGVLLILILGIKYKWNFSVLNKKVEIETLK
jgi:membrane protease YdiL (CAAX protease family)